MSPGQLLSHFERISEAPGAISHLRQFVLELAVRGKLLERETKDEPASDLLRRIQLEKERRREHGQLKPRRTLPPVERNEMWFEIPANWTWVRLGSITDVVMGQSPPGTTYNTVRDGLPLINGPVEFTAGPFGRTVVNQYTTAPTNVCEEGDLLLCVRGSTTGRTNIAGFRACIGRGVAAIRPLFADEYVRLFVWRLRASIIAMGRGIAFPSVSRHQIELLAIPLPPVAEQKRIVVKVAELMALCDQLAAAQAERERRRDRLVLASLGRLSEPKSVDAPREHVRFHIQHLPRLTTRREHLKELRQTILSIAVQGHLVSQHPDDEPSGELLAQIKVERARQLQSGELRRQQPLAASSSASHPFEIPKSWRWVRIDDCFNVGGGIQKTPARTPARNAHPYVGVGNVYRGHLDLSEVKQFELVEGELERFRLKNGDILVVEGNGSANEIGRAARWSGEIDNCVHQNHIIRCRPFLVEMEPFVLKYLNSSMGVEAMQRLAVTSSGLYSLSVGKIRTIPFPLPPLAEQHRIVAKVDALMAVCDKLEAQLAVTDTESSRLLEAVLHQALAVA